MKSSFSAAFVLVLPTLLLPLAAAEGFAGGDDEGFYVGCAANVMVLDGTGTWAGRDFDITAPLPVDEVSTIGLNWDEKLMFGLRPAVGYRFGSRFALQTGLSANVPINSVQTYSTYSGGTYQQSADIEWSQQAADLVAIYYPMKDWNVYVYGGAEVIRIKTEAVLAESYDQVLGTGQVITNTDIYTYDADANTLGAVVGLGIEFPSENMNLTAYGAIQYSLAEVDEDQFLLETTDFSAKVGGASVLFGLKMFLSGR